jgi:hypothetical protein
MKRSLFYTLFAVSIMHFVPVAAAETYTLSKEAFAGALPTDKSDKSPLIPEYTNEFTCDGVKWTIHFEAVDQFSVAGLNAYWSGSKAFVYVSGPAEAGEIQTCTFSSDGFIDKDISKVTFCAAIYNAEASSDLTESCIVKIGDFTKSIEFVPPTGYLNNKIVDRSVIIDPASTGPLSLTFTLPMGGYFAFSSLSIEYADGEVIEPVTVSRVETVAVGHPVTLEASSEEATVFYTVDGSENWAQYNPMRGVVFTEPGDYTLKYYAENGSVKSEVITEKVHVVKVAGLAAAMQANNEIEVVGTVVGQTDRYVLVADDADAALSDCLAVESSVYEALKSARIGDVIKATGRPPDKFGSDIKALGSISSLSVNDQASAPTNIAEVRARMLRRDAVYDIQGRPASSRTRLTVTPSGRKELR